ncbi:hypothetical protein [Streptomyces brasiliensis]|uniref:DUF1508 domain-containing protein n=1 Tax=Streptomyces brasiliensis TaxID=1954 RepID=A0A917KPX4_9ACTN|nr:hypothetical protein [Streptomyces brasiliensis]GGJ21183.1 hypothetical protein GCM10010121_035270 [Streptomyces brasiliensis]
MAGLKGGAVLSGTRFHVDIEVDGSCWWRLTASNGRVIAVAARSYADHGECRAVFEQLCAGIEGLQGELHHAQEGTGWKWRLRDRSGAIAAVSARTYERHSTCQTAYDRLWALLVEVGAGRVRVWDDAE